MTDPESRARNRYFVLSLARLAGGVVMVVGLIAAAGRLGSVPPIAGGVLVLGGAFGFALLPVMLARRWRTPKP